MATAQGPANSSSGPDPAVAQLNASYAALRARDYEKAIAGFRAAIAGGADRSAVRQDLAYTLLKIGENEAARDEFGAAQKLDPANARVALEYAFLCHETGKTRAARRIFASFRDSPDAQVRATARTAFANIDAPLGDGIARWQAVVDADASNFSAQEELARLAEQRDELPLAASAYERAWRLRRDRRDLLVGLGRVLLLAGNSAAGHAWLLAASRGSEPHTAESARALLPSRYPYVAEFRQALDLDPGNVELRRELAFLLLAMNQRPEAEAELRQVVEMTPADRHARRQLSYLWGEKVEPEALVASALEAKRMGEASLAKSYVRDALRYFRIANEADPGDAEVMLKLGWVHNLLKDDRQALEWFDRARRAGDPRVAEEARQAYSRLRPEVAPVRTTFWMFPFYSSRWRDAFTYGQLKAEVRVGRLPVRPYLSARFIGDAGRGLRYLGIAPGQLSENSVVVAGGLITKVKHGMLAWGEAGQAVRFRGQADGKRHKPDFRAGVAWMKGWGRLLGSSGGGWFTEANADAVFLSMFDHDTLMVPQIRSGYTFGDAREGPGLQVQLLWNTNVSLDTRRQAWANFVETGPGVQFRWSALPPGVRVGIHLLRGAYLINGGNVLPPRFWDVRAGVWYAFTR